MLATPERRVGTSMGAMPLSQTLCNPSQGLQSIDNQILERAEGLEPPTPQYKSFSRLSSALRLVGN